MTQHDLINGPMVWPVPPEPKYMCEKTPDMIKEYGA